MKKVWIISALCCVLLCGECSADVIFLKNGGVVIGEISRRSKDWVFIQVANGTVRVRQDDIDEEKMKEAGTIVVGTKEEPTPVVIDKPPVVVDKPVQPVKPVDTDHGGKNPAIGAPELKNKVLAGIRAYLNGELEEADAVAAEVSAQPGKTAIVLNELLRKETNAEALDYMITIFANLEPEPDVLYQMKLLIQEGAIPVSSMMVGYLQEERHVDILEAVIAACSREGGRDILIAAVSSLGDWRCEQAIRFLMSKLGEAAVAETAVESVKSALVLYRNESMMTSKPGQFDPIKVLLNQGIDTSNPDERRAIFYALPWLFEPSEYVSEEEEEIVDETTATEPVDRSVEAAKRAEFDKQQQAIIDEEIKRYRVELNTIAGRFMDHKEMACRLAAVRCVGLTADNRFMSALVKLVAGDDADLVPDVRAYAARALVEFHNDDVLEALIEALKDADSGVKGAAHESLQTLTGQTIDAVYSKWLAWFQNR